MTLSDADLDALTRLGEEATPGPWRWKVCSHTITDMDGESTKISHISAGGDDNTVAIMDSDFWSVDADAELIAAARTALPALLEEVRRLRKIEAAVRATHLHKWRDVRTLEEVPFSCDICAALAPPSTEGEP